MTREVAVTCLACGRSCACAGHEPVKLASRNGHGVIGPMPEGPWYSTPDLGLAKALRAREAGRGGLA